MKSFDFIKWIVFLTTVIVFVSLINTGPRRSMFYFREGPDADFTGYEESVKFLLDQLKDPTTGRIPPRVRELELAFAKQALQKQLQTSQPLTNSYTFQGPENIGGRTRDVVYDIRYNGISNRTIMAGGVSAGIYKSIDGGTTWHRKTGNDQMYSITCIAQDPRPGFQDTWYYGTGETFGGGHSGAPFSSDGIFKSTNNGETWVQLISSNLGSSFNFDRQQDCIWNIAVAPNGDVYMAAIEGIFKSSDGGNTWRIVLGTEQLPMSAYISTDIVITPSGRLYAAFDGQSSSQWDGVWTSVSGEEGTWQRIAGEGAGDSPAGWKMESFYSRIVLAVTPSNENMIYALIAVYVGVCPGVPAQLFRWNLSQGTWTDLSNNLPGCAPDMEPFRTQSGYSMTIAVKPDDPNMVFIGGISLYRSTNGFATAGNTINIGGTYNFSLHTDMHSIVFEPGNPMTMLVGNDGGIQKTTNDLADFVDWTAMNNGFRTLQYYYVSLDPRQDNNQVIGGSQDNGTTRNIGGNGSGFELIVGGDGGPVGISKSVEGTIYEYCSAQLGNIYRRDQAWLPYFAEYIKPNTPPGSVIFISPCLLDPDNTEYIYYVHGDKIYRNNSASTANTENWTRLTGVEQATNGSMIYALRTTRGNYNSGTSSLFFGTATGSVFRLDDPINSDPNAVPVNISGNLPQFLTVSSISVNPRNDDTVLVTFPNYGRINIWWTGNANSANPTWTNVEFNLDLPSIRSSAIAITPNGVEYFVGTSVGLFKNVNLTGQDWTQEGPFEIGNAVVTSLALRPSDNRLLVGTYGYGMWATTLQSNCDANTWTGFASSSWENPDNWSCGYCPNSHSHVIINAGTPNNPIINSNVTIRQLTLNASGVLTVNNGYKLSITNSP